MPHHFVNRLRSHPHMKKESFRHNQIRWESVSAIIYLVGGALFIWGSVRFFPSLESQAENRGAWIFFAGSLLYLVVTAHDTYEVVSYRRQLNSSPTTSDRLELWAAGSYLLGTLLFAAGSIFFLSFIGDYSAGAWCFILGSLLFVTGATIDVLQIVRAPNIRVLQLLNLTALAFVVGSALFVVASVPYLFKFQSSTDEQTVDTFLAAQFVVGSFLFLVGGVFNYRRAFLVIDSATDR
ncbi:MAG: hypothetical protein CMP60_06970 [Flavobacteriales bacterium]|nr:hypothetical protein [Flavobacteriales bacterium]